jgi:hypothetical protein
VFEYDKTVEANRRERPGLLLDSHGQPTHMLSGVHTWPPKKDQPRGSCRSLYTVLTEVNRAAPTKSDDHHSPSLKSSAAPRWKPGDVSEKLPLLFMSADDLFMPWGKQTLVAPNMEDVTAQVCPHCDLSHPGIWQLLQGGAMAPNPRRLDAGFELFFTSAGDTAIYSERASAASGWAKGIYFMSTLDFVTYTPAVRVASINQFNSTSSAYPSWLEPHSCMAKSIARSHDGSRYVILSNCADEGIRPMIATELALDSFTAQPLFPAFFDHDVYMVAPSADGEEWVDLQITFQNQTTAGWNGTGLKYCDNVGLANCASGYRRVVSLRTSKDGLRWSNRAACPLEEWDPHQTGQAFDAQFRACEGGWNYDGMIAPAGGSSSVHFEEAASVDAPDLEFYKLTPMFVGDTLRVVAHALLYAPAPIPLLGPKYGMQPPMCPTDKATGRLDLRQCHGPGIGLERWIGPADGNLSRQPMTRHDAWQRPFRSDVKPSTLFGEGGVIFRGYHIWLQSDWYTSPTARSNKMLLGLPEYRLAGFHSDSNAEFSTAVFSVPSRRPLWINADAHWDATRAAYVMVEVLDAASGVVVPGYERERCVMMNVNGTRLPLEWNGSKPLHEHIVGQRVRLRVFYRAATVFAVGQVALKNTDEAAMTGVWSSVLDHVPPVSTRSAYTTPVKSDDVTNRDREPSPGSTSSVSAWLPGAAAETTTATIFRPGPRSAGGDCIGSRCFVCFRIPALAGPSAASGRLF